MKAGQIDAVGSPHAETTHEGSSPYVIDRAQPAGVIHAEIDPAHHPSSDEDYGSGKSSRRSKDWTNWSENECFSLLSRLTNLAWFKLVRSVTNCYATSATYPYRYSSER